MSNVTKPIMLNETGEQIVQKLAEVAESNKSYELLLNTKADKVDVSAPFNFKGTTTYAKLPTSGNVINDTYYCEDKKCRYTWNGEGWYQSSMNEMDYTDELAKMEADLAEVDSKLSSEIAEVSKMKEYFRTENIFDKTNPENVNGKFINLNGEWLTNASFGESHYMDVVGGKSYTCYYFKEGEWKILKAIAKVWYDENKTQISISYDENSSVAPENAKYLRVTYGTPYIESYMVLDTNVNFTEYIPYYSYEKVEEKHHWNGKIWYAYGTSLTNSDNEGKYAKYVEEFSGMVRVNKGISGGGIVTNTRIKEAIMNVDDGKTEADLITLEIGANDLGATIGNIYDASDNTLCGALNQCIRYLQANTNAQIVLISSTCQVSATSGDRPPEHLYGDHTQFDVWEALEKAAKLNGVYYIPMGESMGLGYARMKNNMNVNYLVDNIHHTELGGYNLAQGVWSYLKNIPLWYSELPQ